MLKVQLVVLGDSLNYFGDNPQYRGGGWNFRIRTNPLELKPSSRSTPVEGEYFGSLDPKTGIGIFETEDNFPLNSYSMSSGKHGWKTLHLQEGGSFQFTLVEGVPNLNAIPKKTSNVLSDSELDKVIIPEKKYKEIPGFKIVSGEFLLDHLKIDWMTLKKRIGKGTYRTIPGNKIVVPAEEIEQVA